MKRIVAVTVVFLMSMVSTVQFNPVVNAQGKAGADVEEKILKLEQAWIAALRNNTPEEANRLFADEAVFTDADGTTHGKADELNSMNKVKWETAEDSDIKMIQHGNTVIVTGKFEGNGKDDHGKKVDVSERWTDVWMQTEHMGWQVVASHSSPVKK